MKPTQASRLFSAIKGFNRNWSAVTSIRDHGNNIIGYKFQCGCGTEKKYLNQNFYDPHGMGVKQMSVHRCVTA
jgi:hypothetical protein